jgi:predicted RNase H-like HicB family nuclease
MRVHGPHGRLTKAPPGDDASMMSIDYPVILKQSEEGYAVSCPALPGCWSQGATEQEALVNIRIAIEEYLAARRSLLQDEDVRTVTVSIA